VPASLPTVAPVARGRRSSASPAPTSTSADAPAPATTAPVVVRNLHPQPLPSVVLAVHFIHSSVCRTSIIERDESKSIPYENVVDSTILFKVTPQLVFLNTLCDVANKYSVAFCHFVSRCNFCLFFGKYY